ncbi:hypothetical protein [Aeromicrobium sp.]|uniref:hypothetical protein n=1 Tax=Aeromicrobium sp. TaxID=1871063 RepID=UPI0019A671A2|nr:hypothetical protein [Aeromicrobium sp.]MBC7633379.1 CsbD family protein [Aeromicrobium sp.]
MTNDQTDKAGEAREGLFDSIAGKAKEVAGAVSGKDDLVEEGQLQQAESRNRKAALADEAVADAKRDAAAQELRETNEEVAQRKDAAEAQSRREESAVERQREAEHAAAGRDAKQQEAEGSKAAEKEADELAESRVRDAGALAADATSTEQRAAAEALRLEREAAAADQQAAQLRDETKN